MSDTRKDKRDVQISGYLEELQTIRLDIHKHPETAYEENRTADIVAERLNEWGLEVDRGLGGTGVVGTLRPRGVQPSHRPSRGYGRSIHARDE